MGNVTTIGLDIAKSVFQVHGVDAAGEIVVRRKLTRGRVLAFLHRSPTTMRPASASSQAWCACNPAATRTGTSSKPCLAAQPKNTGRFTTAVALDKRKAPEGGIDFHGKHSRPIPKESTALRRLIEGAGISPGVVNIVTGFGPTDGAAHKRVFDRVVEGIIERAASIRVGHGFSEGVQMGPVISPIQHDRVMDYILQGRPRVSFRLGW